MTKSPPQSTPPQTELGWRLRVLMAERDIRSAAALQSLLRDVDVHISSQQLVRIVNKLPARLNTELLAGLLRVLDCDIADLMPVKRRSPPVPKVSAPESDSAGADPYSHLRPPSVRTSSGR